MRVTVAEDEDASGPPTPRTGEFTQVLVAVDAASMVAALTGEIPVAEHVATDPGEPPTPAEEAPRKLPGEVWRGTDDDTGHAVAIAPDPEDGGRCAWIYTGIDWDLRSGPGWNRTFDAWAMAERARAERAERKVEQLAAEVQAGLDRERAMRADLATVRTSTDNVWRWMGDPKHDDPESLACPVVMQPETLRAMLARAERAEAALESANVYLDRARGRHTEAEQDGAALQARVGDLEAALCALLVKVVGQCCIGSESDRCPEPAVYGILTGYTCAKHRSAKHPHIIGGPAVEQAVRALGLLTEEKRDG